VRRGVFMSAVLGVLLVAGWSAAQFLPGNPMRGQVIYQQSCARCHGTTGAGDGPDAQRMVVRPADLRSPGMLLKSDLELLRSIAYGVAFSPMHEWRDQMTDQEMWDVVGYIRTFTAPQAQPISDAATHGSQPHGASKQEAPTLSDTRVPLRLPAPVQEGMRLTMREHLEALHAIVAALAREDYEKAAAVAHEDLGFPKHHQAMQREAGATFPPKYHELAMVHHQVAEDLAGIIPSKDMKKILPHLEKTMKACVACHQAYKL